ncbi:hypothetical protein A2Z56_02530 [Candidatus Kaiserbacteria bacterium RIFCSPHIGHO2_12_45_16]|nr:MAG: hypothetical protein A2Z56_02530 [Candidatus Kaiserbacteria bacterium RIFCSPHIGHO2_12_45_16]
MTKYRIVAATKWYHQSDYIVQKWSWFWPFWVQATPYSVSTIEEAQKQIDWLRTNITSEVSE